MSTRAFNSNNLLVNQLGSIRQSLRWGPLAFGVGLLTALLCTASHHAAVAQQSSTTWRVATVCLLGEGQIRLCHNNKVPYAPGMLLLLRKPSGSFQQIVLRVDSAKVGTLNARWGETPTPAIPKGLRVGDQVEVQMVDAKGLAEDSAATRKVSADEGNASPAQAHSETTSGRSSLQAQYTQQSANRTAIVEIKSNRIRLAAGEDRGIRSSMVLAVLGKQGAAPFRPVAQVQIDTVEPSDSWGRIVGDATAVYLGQEVELPHLAIVAGASVERERRVSPSGKGTQSPSRIKEERDTGAENRLSHYTVPRTDKSYALLGSLAADGLVQRYPARVFYDDTLFHHRPGDDLILTRGQITLAIAEALDKAFSEEGKPTVQQMIALRLLVIEYQQELPSLGYLPAVILKEIERRMKPGINVGVSGWAKLAGLSRSGDGPLGEPEDVSKPGTAEGEGGHLDLQTDVYALLAGEYQFYGRFNDRVYQDEGFTQVQRALLKKSLGRWIDVEVGRGDFWWGPGGFGTLLLSDNGGPYDYVKTQWRQGRFLYEGFGSVIQESPVQRTLYGHRVEYSLSPEVRLGIAETMTVPDQSLDPVLMGNALIPLLPFEEIDRFRNFSKDNNKLASLYGEASLSNGFSLYGEFLIDDFIVKRSESSDHRLGQLFGVYFSDPESPHKKNLRMEFARFDEGVYLPRRADDPYFNDGLAIGYPLGVPDDRAAGFQDLRFEGNYMLFSKLTLGGGWELADFGRDRPVLSRQQILRARATYDLSSRSSLSLRFQNTFTTNADFVEGVDQDEKSLSLEFMSAF